MGISFRRFFHQHPHFPHRAFHPDIECPCNHRVADAHFLNLLDRSNGTDVQVIQSVSRVYPEPEGASVDRGAFDNTEEFFSPQGGSCVGVLPGVNFDHIGPAFTAGVNLPQYGIHEEAHGNPLFVQPADGTPNTGKEPGDIESSLGREFQPALWNECSEIGTDFACDSDDPVGGRHLEVKFCPDRIAQAADVLVVDMTAIFPEVTHDTRSPGLLCRPGGPYGVGFVATAGITDRGDVIDVDRESQSESFSDDELEPARLFINRLQTAGDPESRNDETAGLLFEFGIWNINRKALQ